MLRLDVLGTGSPGNCYALHAGGSVRLLDAGLQIRQIVEGVEDWSQVVGCLVTHEHMDHAKAVYDLTMRGVPVFMSRGTRGAVIKADPRCGIYLQTQGNATESGRALRTGDFTILPFGTQHDAAEPQGFIVRYDPTGEKLLYATDTYYLRNTFPGIHYWLIECNYVDEIALEQMQAGTISLELRGRLVKSHMSLRRLLDVFKANDLTETRRIIICHLSDQRSDEQRMVDEITKATGIQTDAADRGMRFDLDLCPF